MATTIPIYLQARHLTSCRLEFGSPVAGSITWGTAINLAAVAVSGTGTFYGLQFNPRKETVALRNSDSGVGNNQDEFIDFSATVREIVAPNGIGNLALGFASQSHVRCVAKYKMPGDTIESAIAFIGLIQSVNKSIQRGENVDDMSVMISGIAPYAGPASGIPTTFTT